jgi:hypothetical protein
MYRRIVKTINLGTFLLVALLSVAWQIQAQDATGQNANSSYPSMAPLDQYLMADRNAEIALARTAAPKSISAEATVVVLGRHGY